MVERLDPVLRDALTTAVLALRSTGNESNEELSVAMLVHAVAITHPGVRDKLAPVDQSAVVELQNRASGSIGGVLQRLRFSREMVRVLEQASLEASNRGRKSIGPSDFLAAVVVKGDETSASILQRAGISLAALRSDTL